MAFIDYYKIMGVNRDTPQSEIRDAYKKRAKLFHPDLHPNDPKAKAKFQALNEAYDVLNDPEKRKKYDQYGEHWREAESFAHNGSGTSQGFEDMDFSQFQNLGSGGFSSFFESLFGGINSGQYGTSGGHFGSSFTSPQKAEAHASVTIDLYTAMLGGNIMLQTQNGKIKLKVKPCTKNGSKVRLKGMGHTNPDGSRTDLIITYNVKLPTSLSERQKQLLREMQAG